MKNEMKTIIEYLLLQQKLYVNTYKYNLATNHYVLLKIIIETGAGMLLLNVLLILFLFIINEDIRRFLLVLKVPQLIVFTHWSSNKCKIRKM